ncbi:MAG: acetate/propionate family kinase [Saprospirales bacterium]|nr:acetate/propionate family kinase [Saprospirales bacterium]MBK8491506.1 acetate/propionate family kinase [Saprospirales bacterium]
MNILVLNVGSSSIKAAIVHSETGLRSFSVEVERVPTQPVALFSDGAQIEFPEIGHEAVLRALMPFLRSKIRDLGVRGIGHRVAHGGSRFDQPVQLSPELVLDLEELNDLAPIHNPLIMQGVRIGMEYFPDLPHVAVFDTSFHHTLPKRAYTYALPKWLREKYHIRRYGFHGTSHEYVVELAASHLDRDIRELRIISCHLGSGCSVTAIEYGRSVETSMGMTPLEGLAMSTRSGDIDPGLFYYLTKKGNFSAEELNDLLNLESGLKGLSGHSDMRDIIEQSEAGDEDSRLALQVFTHRVLKYIGAYSAAMGGVDAIIFTGGIGENSSVVRYRVTQKLHYLGAILEEDANNDIQLTDSKPVAKFSSNNSRVQLLAVKTDEQLAIARKAKAVVEGKDTVNPIPRIPIAISARHVHLQQETVEALFGKGHQLNIHKWLSQPGQFAAQETVTLVGPKNKLENVRILGPCRDHDQVEISRTDEFFIGIDAPIRESGKIENSPGIKLIGPKGEVLLPEGVICAWRHIHMNPSDAATFGVEDRDVVDVAVINGTERDLVFGNVLIRVSEDYILEMHIDTDEGNAAEIESGNTTGALMATKSKGVLQKRRIMSPVFK